MRRPAIALVLAALACGGLVEPVAPESMDPGPAQAQAAAIILECTGMSVDPTSVAWYTVESIRGHANAVGAWNRPNVIYLLDAYAGDVKVSAHELLHHVLHGDPGHHNPAWTSCGVWP